jgi:hypothetical protein
VLCGFGGSMDEVPMMLLPSIPTMVWGGKLADPLGLPEYSQVNGAIGVIRVAASSGV